jgi:hypothetical protein
MFAGLRGVGEPYGVCLRFRGYDWSKGERCVRVLIYFIAVVAVICISTTFLVTLMLGKRFDLHILWF